jgi:hypothetical protein
MILLAFIGLIGILLVINIMSRNSFVPIKLMSAFAWTIPLIWVIGYPPSFITSGSNIQTAIILIIIGMLLICGFNAFRQPLQISQGRIDKNGESISSSFENGSLHMPNIIRNQYRSVTGYQQSGRDRVNAMMQRSMANKQQAHDQLFPDNNKRRR